MADTDFDPAREAQARVREAFERAERNVQATQPVATPVNVAPEQKPERLTQASLLDDSPQLDDRALARAEERDRQAVTPEGIERTEREVALASALERSGGFRVRNADPREAQAEQEKIQWRGKEGLARDLQSQVIEQPQTELEKELSRAQVVAAEILNDFAERGQGPEHEQEYEQEYEQPQLEQSRGRSR